MFKYIIICISRFSRIYPFRAQKHDRHVKRRARAEQHDAAYYSTLYYMLVPHRNELCSENVRRWRQKESSRSVCHVEDANMEHSNQTPMKGVCREAETGE